MKHNNPHTIETYIALNNPDDTLMLLKELGSPKPKNTEDMLRLLHKATEMYPEKAFAELAKIETPYYQLIMSHGAKHEETKPETKSATHSNCSGGCSGCSGEKSNADGDLKAIDPTVAKEKDKTIIYLPSFFTSHPTATAVGATILAFGLLVGVYKLLEHKSTK